MATVAFIGLGNMGGPMATNLVRADHAVTVFDLVPEACAQLEQAGAQVAESTSAAVAGADYVISMLPAGKHVAGIYRGSGDDGEGLLAQLDASTTVLDCSTIDAATAREVGAAAQARGIGFMDAPVSGGVAAAVAGTLAFMCGGDADTFEKARLILKDMGKNIFHAGPSGAGHTAQRSQHWIKATPDSFASTSTMACSWMLGTSRPPISTRTRNTPSSFMSTASPGGKRSPIAGTGKTQGACGT